MKLRLFIFLLAFPMLAVAQSGGEMTVVTDTTKTATGNNDIDPLTPAKAAFYSALFPGLGQAYNKKYWKMPIVYGAIGASIYFYVWNDKNYNEYRDAYKQRLAGFTGDKYSFLDDQRLIDGQKFYQKNRDLSALCIAAFYILNIVDANVDAHLKQFNVSDDLSFEPQLIPADAYTRVAVGFGVKYRF